MQLPEDTLQDARPIITISIKLNHTTLAILHVSRLQMHDHMLQEQ